MSHILHCKSVYNMPPVVMVCHCAYSTYSTYQTVNKQSITCYYACIIAKKILMFDRSISELCDIYKINAKH